MTYSCFGVKYQVILSHYLKKSCLYINQSSRYMAKALDHGTLSYLKLDVQHLVKRTNCPKLSCSYITLSSRQKVKPMNHKIQLMALHTSLPSVDLLQIFQCSKFETSVPLGCLETELMSQVNIFFHVQSSMKYMSWLDMHHCFQKTFITCTYEAFEGSFPFGY